MERLRMIACPKRKLRAAATLCHVVASQSVVASLAARSGRARCAVVGQIVPKPNGRPARAGASRRSTDDGDAARRARRSRGSRAAPAAQAALRDFHPIVRRWFTETLGAPSAPQQQGLAGDRERRERAHPRADRHGQDARGVPLGAQRAHHRWPRASARERDPPPLHLAAQGAQQRHPAQPRASARGAARALHRGRRGVSRDPRRRANG